VRPVKWRGLAIAVVASTLMTVAGCSRTVTGTAQRATQTPDISARGYGYANDSCGRLLDSTVQQLAGAEELVRTYSGAVCQYILMRQGHFIDLNYAWFEVGTLDRERSVAQADKAQVTEIEVERHNGFLARRTVTGSACAATAATTPGVASWWVQVRGDGRNETGIDPCELAQRLLAKTLASDL
jgi:hypothetical protein